MSNNPYRQLPSVSMLLDHPRLQTLRSTTPHDLFVEAIRLELDTHRQAISETGIYAETQLIDALDNRIRTMATPRCRTVINATGIVLHTNLGRSPLAECAARAAYDAARRYTSLELDLSTGERSSRLNSIRDGLCRITGGESATAVNNCAAATVIALRSIAAGKDVVVSRGQLVEIGGNFRIPEILTASGARLREVGTTNITRLSDYESAIGPNTAALLRVHCSNFRIRGFTETVSIEELAALGRKHNVPVIDDAGSGSAIDLTSLGFHDEPTIREGLAAGADLVLFSGDKLLGGPQSGIIAGKKKWIDAIDRDPLMRALRLDKMSLAALAATLELHRAEPVRFIPILQMIATPLEELRLRSMSLAAKINLMNGLDAEVSDGESYVGGGSLADQVMPTIVIAIERRGMSDYELAKLLRTSATPVLSRVQNGRVLLDLRTVFPDQEEELVAAIRHIECP